MADQLNMGGLSLQDSQHAGGGPRVGGGSAYIPPHLRNQAPPPMPGPAMDGPPGPAPGPGGMNNSAWASNA